MSDMLELLPDQILKILEKYGELSSRKIEAHLVLTNEFQYDTFSISRTLRTLVEQGTVIQTELFRFHLPVKVELSRSVIIKGTQLHFRRHETVQKALTKFLNQSFPSEFWLQHDLVFSTRPTQTSSTLEKVLPKSSDESDRERCITTQWY